MKVYIETYGCQMNEYDSELVKAVLKDQNLSFTTSLAKADIVLINTCSVRENANRKIYARVHEVRHLKKDQSFYIGILGCMVTNLGKELFDLPVDFLAGPDSYRRLPAMINESIAMQSTILDDKLSKQETYQNIYPLRQKGVNAWISVMRGCNNFCSFCVVPYTRGRERSKSLMDIYNECQRLADEGFRQVTLLGQNVNSYHHEGNDFAALLDKVSEIDGIKRIRFVSPHPKDFPGSLIDIVAQNDKICNHIHLPLQAGNDRILGLMRRTYTQKQYLELVQRIKEAIPDITLTTDIIVGFPTETAAECKDTKNVLEKVRFDSSFIFKYSERPGTLAAKKYPDDIAEEEKTRRIVSLNELQKEISLQKNQSHIGKVHDVLLEKKSTKKSTQDYQGRNDGNKVVIISKGPYQIGDFLRVKIEDASAHTLMGTVIAPQS
ncbi:tRNA (N6-isopentenyl adenosine(37)-C2)-methylthiotransferase MiaB [candidate division KSB1 bacterium]|nr:tRNA (N6-isopentenyl adenosine(37)-C2)-methylthiotransferase MiaB [candidate division KSB1 bacterium]